MHKRLVPSGAAQGDHQDVVTFHWTAAHVAQITATPANTIPPFAAPPVGARPPGLDVWDMWPVETADGGAALCAGRRVWMALAAPVLPDPESRHAIARIHWVVETADEWRDHGPAFPDGFTPGSREWSGSALYDAATGGLWCWFTAAGRRGEATPTFEQRLFGTQGRLTWAEERPIVAAWSPPVQIVAADDIAYMRVAGGQGAAGTIKAFRDPGYFCDPVSGRHLMFFTASRPRAASAWNGRIGVAESDGGPQGPWRLLPPPVCADGVNNELERPHMRHVNGLYYLFWSTQRKVFATDGPSGPTGLYGVVGRSPLGPFAALNGTGLVAANPAPAPSQAYSWWVLGDGSVTSFADMPGVDSAAITAAVATPDQHRRYFAGCPAPYFTLALDGDTARVVPA